MGAAGRLRPVRSRAHEPAREPTHPEGDALPERKVWQSRIGVGAPSTPTPRGRFWIRTRLRNLGGSAIYGPWAFGTGAYSVLSEWPGGGVIGIHGTNQPELIPGRPSHGCIRVTNRDIRRLVRLMPIGTPVRIL